MVRTQPDTPTDTCELLSAADAERSFSFQCLFHPTATNDGTVPHSAWIPNLPLHSGDLWMICVGESLQHLGIQSMCRAGGIVSYAWSNTIQCRSRNGVTDLANPAIQCSMTGSFVRFRNLCGIFKRKRSNMEGAEQECHQIISHSNFD